MDTLLKWFHVTIWIDGLNPCIVSLSGKVVTELMQKIIVPTVQRGIDKAIAVCVQCYSVVEAVEHVFTLMGEMHPEFCNYRTLFGGLANQYLATEYDDNFYVIAQRDVVEGAFCYGKNPSVI